MDHAFQLTNVTISLINLVLSIISMKHSLIKLIIHAGASLDQGLSLFVQHGNSRVLSKAFLLPLRQSTIVLIDSALLSLS